MDEFRVESWNDFIGQTALKSRMGVHIQAARKQYRTLDHVLLVGPTGFGKTSLSGIISSELDAPLETYEMPITDKSLGRIVRDHQGVVLFDEIHRAPTKLQESLLPLLEFGWVQNSHGLKQYASNLTVIGATTEPDKVIKPLYDRFPIRPDFDDYTDAEMGDIVAGMARKAGVTLVTETAEALGRATGGTPRRARQFVLAARDLTVTTNRTPTASEILALCRIDETGVTQQHRDYLMALESLGGIAGLTPLKNYLILSEGIVRDLERLLLKQELIQFTERGRELTRRGQLKIEGK